LKAKSYKNFIQVTGDDLGVPKSTVEDCIDFFYARVRKSLTDMKHRRIHVNNFGTFRVKKAELDKLYRKYKNHLTILENPETFTQMKIKKEVEQKFEKVMSLYEIINAEGKRKEQTKRIRNEFIKEDLGTPEGDNGGN
jgi:nucleoid DNA-binding protein